MKAQIIRDDLEVSPAYAELEELQPLIVRKTIMRDDQMQSVPFWRNGAVIDFPDSYRLVRQGCAIPADEICAKRCNRTPEQMADAQYAYERLVRRIDPDDFDLYDNGVIVGYDEKGDYILGPNGDRMSQFRPAPSTPLSEDDDI